MPQDAETTTEPATLKLTEEDVRRIVREEVERAFQRDPAARKASIIASKGTLDWAYPPLILATTAAAAGMDTGVFFTFYGLNIIHKDAARKLKVDPVGNPAMPMPMPIPDIVSAMPGMVPLASRMMRSRFATHHVATIAELLDAARDVGVRLIACQMTMEVFGYTEGDFIDGVEFAGAAAFMSQARRSHVTMFI
ncbi:MAG TPA: DsrE/DsrF/DrsH-like family protein [Actinomycetota bacterium]|jgi:peroxiredoxin family protein|nr:DsrE/DsrF/DrsH-like family protein [Actinomycetota bacterium]